MVRVIREEGLQALPKTALTHARRHHYFVSDEHRLRLYLGAAKARMKVAESMGWVSRIQTHDLAQHDAALSTILEQTTSTDFLPPKHGESADRNSADWNSNLKSERQRERLARVADLCARRYPGDFLEIGAYLGRTTVRLAQVAQAYGRRVIVVDPWQTGSELNDGTTYDGDYQQFWKNVEPYSDNIDIVRASSLEERARAVIANRDLAFSYVDGLHTFRAALSDIRAVRHTAGIIAVDDTHWIADYQYHGQIRLALARGAHLLGRVAIGHPLSKEAYLLPRPTFRP
jgi:hypothetical protein